MRIESYTETNVGKIRKNNEDNFFANGNYKKDTNKLNETVISDSKDKTSLFAVCDGMGGEEFGEKASLIAVSTLAEYLKSDFNVKVSEYVEKANKKICDLILENNGMRSGTTFAALYIENERATVYNIGDSRVYLLRDGKLKQLSLDHTRIQQMLSMGVISPEVAKTHKDRHVLTQHFGIFPDEMIISEHRVENIEIRKDDVFLLCSDGLTDMLSDEEIENIMKSKKTIKEIGKILIETALKNGGKDNVTVQLVKCKPEKNHKKLLICIGTLLIVALCTIIAVQMGIAGRFSRSNNTEEQIEVGQSVVDKSDKRQEPTTEKNSNEDNVYLKLPEKAKAGQTIKTDLIIKNLKDIVSADIYIAQNSSPMSFDLRNRELRNGIVNIMDIQITVPEDVSEKEVMIKVDVVTKEKTYTKSYKMDIEE